MELFSIVVVTKKVICDKTFSETQNATFKIQNFIQGRWNTYDNSYNVYFREYTKIVF